MSDWHNNQNRLFSAMLPNRTDLGSADGPLDHHTYKIIRWNIYTAMTLITTGFNAFIVLAIVPTRRLHTMANALLVHFALIGIILSVFVLPVLAAAVLEDSVPAACSIHGFILTLVLTARNFTLVSLAWDQYQTIAVPLRYDKSINIKRLCIWISSAWAIGGILALVPFFQASSPYTFLPSYDYCAVDPSRFQNTWYSLVFMFVLFLAPGVMLACCYFEIFRLARSHSRRIGNLVTMLTMNVQCPIAPTNPTPLMALRGNRASWTTLLFLVSFLVINIPFCAVLVLEVVQSNRQHPILVAGVTMLFHSGSLIDAVIYGLRKNVLRESFMTFVRMKCADDVIHPAMVHLPMIATTPSGIDFNRTPNPNRQPRWQLFIEKHDFLKVPIALGLTGSGQNLNSPRHN